MDKRLLHILTNLQRNRLTDIQAKAIPAIEEGKNTIIDAPTGSGKTLAYLIPAIEAIDPSNPSTQILILSPVRDLSRQIYEEAIKLANPLAIHCVLLTGGIDSDILTNNLNHHPQIVIATLGRLKKAIDDHEVNFNQLRMLIIDEADAIFTSGQKEDLIEVLKYIPSVQTVLSSATSIDYESLFHQPFHIVHSKEVSHQLKEGYLLTDHKTQTLLTLLNELPIQKAIIFFNYKQDAHEIADLLQTKGILAQDFSTYYNQAKRNQILRSFKQGKIRVLCATDAAERGLDIPHISHIIHYDIPLDTAIYIHRSGRSAHQLNTFGQSITLLNKEDQNTTIGKDILQTLQPFTYTKEPTDLSIPFMEENTITNQTTTLFIRSGKKDKVRVGDIVGAFSKVIDSDKIGVIEVQDHYSKVTINTTDNPLIEQLIHTPIKGKLRKIERFKKEG